MENYLLDNNNNYILAAFEDSIDLYKLSGS